LLLDVRTIGLISALMPFVLGLIMTVYWRERKTYGGFGYWVIANFAFGTGYLLVSLRGIVPDFYSIIIGNLITIIAEILIYQGIQLFYNRPVFHILNSIILVLFIILQSFFTYVDPNINTRIVLVSFIFFILVVRAGLSLVKCPFPGLHRTAQSAGQIFFVTAVLPLTRSIYALSRTEPIDLFSDTISSWYAMLAMMSILVWTFYFFLINSARLEMDLETARSELLLIANTDPLTGLYNRRHFLEHAELEFQRAKRHEHDVSFLLLDVDDFKLINDNYGHDAGDIVMINLATIFRRQIRAFDMVARFGGDEFVIVLVNADEDEAFVAAERIRNVVEQTPMVFDSGTMNIHLSVGIAAFSIRDTELGVVLKRADKALYQAKRQGRNQVQTA